MPGTKVKGWWTVPPIWKGGTAFIIGGGPSLMDMDLTPLEDPKRRVIGVNNAYELGGWIDCCYFGDCRWFDWNKQALRQFSGLVVTTCQRKGPWMPGWVHQLKRNEDKTMGLSYRPSVLSWNNNSGASAINLAVLFGVKRVVLLGFDMKVREGAPNKGHNWHDRHEGNHTPEEKIYKSRFMDGFRVIAKDLKRGDVECVNATPDSALDVFPMVKLEDVL